MNTYLKYQPAAIQFLAFLALAAGFFGIQYIISQLFFSEVGAILVSEKAEISVATLQKYKMAQFAACVISFIIPALLFGYFSSPRALPYVGLKNNLSGVVTGACLLLLFAITPFISWLGELNSKMNFGGMQEELLKLEELYNRALQTFLRMDNIGDMFINLFIMALLPAIGEELFFRGALQKSLLRVSEKPWLAILVSSLVFALLHGTFFKILPIFTLGLLLGTVYYYSNNLWYNIIIHFFNNAFAVISVYYADKSQWLRKLATDDLSVPVYLAVISLIIAFCVIYFIKKQSKLIDPHFAANDE